MPMMLGIGYALTGAPGSPGDGGGDPPGAAAYRHWRVLGGISGATGNSQYAAWELRGTPSGPDLTGSGTISAIAEASPASNLLDGNPATDWVGNNRYMQHISYDFGEDVSIEEMLLQYTVSNFTRSWNVMTISVSPDGSTWTPIAIAKETGTKVSSGTLVIDVTPDADDEAVLDILDPHRYWRMVVTEMGSTSIQFNEFTLLNGTDDMTTIHGGTPSSDNVFFSDGPAKAFDRNDSTRWFSNTLSDTAYIQWDFGAANEQVIDGYKMKAGAGSQLSMPRGWKFQCSDNGTDWFTADFKTNQSAFASLEERTFSL